MCFLSRRLPPVARLFIGWLLATVSAGTARAQFCCDDAVPRAKVESTISATELRVAADPNNLPFSNDRLEGFENKLAALVASDLKLKLVYEWRAQRRGFFRHTLKEGQAQLVMSVPVKSERALVTQPYYRSSYVFVSRKDRDLKIRNFDDPELQTLRVGVQLVGDDGVNTPPVHALAARGVVNNVIGYTVYGDYSEENPPARIVDAVVAGDVDTAIIWGPLAGYFAKKSKTPLTLVETPAVDEKTTLPLMFEMGVGVRKDQPELRKAVDAVLVRRAKEIQQILDEYGIPQSPERRESKAER